MEYPMDWDDDEFNAGYDEMGHGGHSSGVVPDEASLSGLDPMDITDPASAYFFLSEDAQDEITGTDKRRMECRVCGHRFTGEIYDRCPKCDSLDTEEVLSFIDDEDEGADSPNMQCLSCGHTFAGDIYDRCPECFSPDTEPQVESDLSA
jgi:predicted Zn-ribbon and HTH transcriptional regulator